MKKGKIVKSPQDFVKGKMYSIEEDLLEHVFEFSHLDEVNDPSFVDCGGFHTHDGYIQFFFSEYTWIEVS